MLAGMLQILAHIPTTGLRETPTALFVIKAKGLELVALLIVSWVMSRSEKRTIADYGLPPRRAFRSEFWHGAVFGLGAITLVIGVMDLAGVLRLSGPLLDAPTAAEDGVLWGVAFLIVGMLEEVLLRGYLLLALARAMRFWPAAIASSILFTLMHIPNPGETAFGLAQVFLIGIVFSIMLRRTGSLWLPIGFHAAWDWGQSYLYGVADSGIVVTGHLFAATIHGTPLLSGGTVGPEGSIVSLIVNVCVGVVAWRMPQTPEPTIPSQELQELPPPPELPPQEPPPESVSASDPLPH